MKTVKVSELIAHLSEYLRMAGEGRLVVGTQDWDSLKIESLDPPVDSAALRAVLDDLRADAR